MLRVLNRYLGRHTEDCPIEHPKESFEFDGECKMKNKEKKERKLSKAEIKRKEEFEVLADKLSNEGYAQKLIGISETEMNTKVFLVTIPIMIPFLALYFLVGNKWNLGDAGFFISIAIFCVLIVIHEGLHGVTWALFTKNKWKSISFGIMVESFTPYCNCKEPLKKHQIIIGALMPTIILGVGFCIAAIIFGSTLLLFTAFLNILGCGGDLLIILKLLLYKSDAADILFIDHPYEIGTAVFEKNN